VQVPEDGLGDLGLLIGSCPAELVEGDVEPVVNVRVQGVVLVANLKMQSKLFAYNEISSRASS